MALEASHLGCHDQLDNLSLWVISTHKTRCEEVLSQLLGPYRIPLWKKSPLRLPFWNPTESLYRRRLPDGFHSGTLQNPPMDKFSPMASILGPYRIALWTKSPPWLLFWNPVNTLYQRVLPQLATRPPHNHVQISQAALSAVLVLQL